MKTNTTHQFEWEKGSIYWYRPRRTRKTGCLFSRKHVLQTECVVCKLCWSLLRCMCSEGTKTLMLSSLFNLPLLCHSAGLGMHCNTWALGDHLRCSPGPCFHILDEAKSCTWCNQSEVHFPVSCMNKRQNGQLLKDSITREYWEEHQSGCLC